MLGYIKKYFADFISLLYPHVCLSCSAALLGSEEVICFRCENDLPKTNHYNTPDNSLMKRFAGRVPITGAAALYSFNKGSGVQTLLHQLKYNNRQDVGEYIGSRFGHQLKTEASIIKNIDLVVPVPLHWKKLRKRGYNQCDSLAKGIAEALDVPFSSTALERRHENISQTKKNRFERWENVSEIFEVVEPLALEGKHILLVDDVVTTGSTAEACLQTILKINNTRASFAAIAAAVR
jgi:ComF family protein